MNTAHRLTIVLEDATDEEAERFMDDWLSNEAISKSFSLAIIDKICCECGNNWHPGEGCGK